MRLTFKLVFSVALLCAICALTVSAGKKKKPANQAMRDNIINISIAAGVDDAAARAKTNSAKAVAEASAGSTAHPKSSKGRDISSTLAWVKATQSKASKEERCAEYDKQLRGMFDQRAKSLDRGQLIEYTIALKGNGMYETLVADLHDCLELASKANDLVGLDEAAIDSWVPAGAPGTIPATAGQVNRQLVADPITEALAGERVPMETEQHPNYAAHTPYWKMLIDGLNNGAEAAAEAAKGAPAGEFVPGPTGETRPVAGAKTAADAQPSAPARGPIDSPAQHKAQVAPAPEAPPSPPAREPINSWTSEGEMAADDGTGAYDDGDDGDADDDEHYVEEMSADEHMDAIAAEKDPLRRCELELNYEMDQNLELEEILLDNDDEISELSARVGELEALAGSAQLEAQQAREALKEVEAKLAEAEAKLEELQKAAAPEPPKPVPVPSPVKPKRTDRQRARKEAKEAREAANDRVRMQTSSTLSRTKNLSFGRDRSAPVQQSTIPPEFSGFFDY